jgi:hypothetical protein
MTLDNSGRLGIGTTSPSYQLEVVPTSGSYNASVSQQSDIGGGIAITGNSNGSNSRVALVMRGSDNIGAAIAVAREDSGSTWKTYMAFYTNNQTGSNVKSVQENMRLDSGGNLNITGKLTSTGFVGNHATLTASITSTAASNIVSNGSGYIFFSIPNSKYYNWDTSVFQLNSGGNGGITILKSGWIKWSYIQDLIARSTNAYCTLTSYINGTNSRNQLTMPSASLTWTSVYHHGVAYVNANDVLTFNMSGGGGYSSIDYGDWTFLDILWIGG